MSNILLITAPIFLLIALGYGSVRTELVPGAWLPALGGFVIRIALPAMMFRSLSQRALAEVMNYRYLLAYAAGSLAVLAGAVLWARYVRRESLERSAILGMGAAVPNSVFIGYPVALQVVGPVAGTALALCVIVENVIMLPLCLALADAGNASHEPFQRAIGRALAGLRKNPLMLAVATGVLCSALRVRLPLPVGRAVELLSGASSPVALFYIGGNLVGLPLRGMFLDVYVIGFGKLILHPLAVAAGVLLFAPVDPALRIAAVLIASSPMLSIYPIFGARHAMAGFCAATLLIATLFSFVTTSTTIWLVQAGRAVP